MADASRKDIYFHKFIFTGVIGQPKGVNTLLTEQCNFSELVLFDRICDFPIKFPRVPLEMHALHFKHSYLNYKEALRHSDGIICATYIFQVNNKCISLLNFMIKTKQLKNLVQIKS